MAVRVDIEGLDEVMANINAEVKNIQGRTSGGLLAGGLIIQRESQKRVPVRYGFLKGSAYTRKTPEDPMVVEVGYTAAYAIYVHENLEAHHDVGQAKYLESAARDKQSEVVDAVAKRVRGETPEPSSSEGGE